MNTVSKRGSNVAAIRCLKFVTLAIIVFAMNGAAAAQDRMVLGPRQFERDTSGAGAVLCSWAIYLSVQSQTAACNLPRRPVDDAIDEAVAAMDEFIMANSSLRPTRAMLDDFKRRAAETELNLLRQRGMLQKTCEGRDLEMFRRPNADEIRDGVKKMLAVPREPVMNPCL